MIVCFMKSFFSHYAKRKRDGGGLIHCAIRASQKEKENFWLDFVLPPPPSFWIDLVMPQLCKEKENRTEKGSGDFDDEEMKIKSAIFVWACSPFCYWNAGLCLIVDVDLCKRYIEIWLFSLSLL